MEEDAINSLQGQVRALSLTLTAIITGLPKDIGERAAKNLQAALDVQREQESMGQPASAPSVIAVRGSLADAYFELLVARSLAG